MLAGADDNLGLRHVAVEEVAGSAQLVVVVIAMVRNVADGSVREPFHIRRRHFSGQIVSESTCGGPLVVERPNAWESFREFSESTDGHPAAVNVVDVYKIKLFCRNGSQVGNGPAMPPIRDVRQCFQRRQILFPAKFNFPHLATRSTTA